MRGAAQLSTFRGPEPVWPLRKIHLAVQAFGRMLQSIAKKFIAIPLLRSASPARQW
jgi:hypothetical protein